jgi:hypothetical protein
MSSGCKTVSFPEALLSGGSGLIITLILSVLAGIGCGGDQTAGSMAIPLSQVALQGFLKPYAQRDFLTFPETREHPIRLFDGIPEAWANREPEQQNHLTVSAQPGEYFVFQIGVYAHRRALRNLRARWTDLAGPSSIAETSMTCFNLGGIDYLGRPFRKRVDLARGRVQPLWFGVAIPDDARGSYRTTITIDAENVRPSEVEVLLSVGGERVDNSGFDRGKSLSRLAWLNTTLGMGAGPTRGLVPLRRSGRRLEVLGRRIELAENGLPSSISSSFEPSNQFLTDSARALLHGPFRFIIEREDSSYLVLEPGPLRFTSESPSSVQWKVAGSSPEVTLSCSGRMEFDGFLDYALTVSAEAPLRIRDIRLEVPLRREMAEYMMGLNHEGGLRPAQWNWHWDTTRNQDMLWIGTVNGGLRLKWKAENYVRPLINLYYAYGPLHLPPSWGNGGRGGVNVLESGDTVLVSAFSGPRQLNAGDKLHYDLELLVTPLKKIDPDVRWGDRYVHGGGRRSARRKLALADSLGANIINIHHAEDLYPFINYPYLDENVPALRRLVDDAHAQNRRLKLYYTTRELTKNLPEFWAFFSLNGEVIYPGPAEACTTIINPRGPDPWLKENLKEHYIPAWLNPIVEGPFAGELDLAVITTPDSRLNNFYIGGLDWMLAHLGIDGVYVDDSALDRVTMRRARTLIDAYRSRGRIDFHSWNHFNALAGYANCLNMYMDLLPYIDLAWIGEQRNYDRLPDHWLIEIAGIPYGVCGQMLEGGGNPWRGMVYGITNRAGWAGNPAEIWKFWDAFDIQSMRMIGYWDANSPVTCDNELVKATLYAGRSRSILAVAGWGETDQNCTLSVDWRALGLDSTACGMEIPRIPDFQDAGTLASLENLTIPAGKGYLIVIERKGP